MLVERLYAIIQSGGVYEFTNNLKCLNGSELECSWRVSCIYDEDGAATKFLLTVYRNVNKSPVVSLVNERVERKYCDSNVVERRGGTAEIHRSATFS